MIKRGCVYVIGNKEVGVYKIGFTRRTVGERLADIQSMSPLPLAVITHFLVFDAPRIEQQLHQKFEKKHSHGEWFKLDAVDLDSLAGCVDDGDLFRDQDPQQDVLKLKAPLPKKPTFGELYWWQFHSSGNMGPHSTPDAEGLLYIRTHPHSRLPVKIKD